MAFSVTVLRHESPRARDRCLPPEYFRKRDPVVARSGSRSFRRSSAPFLGRDTACEKKENDEEEVDSSEDVHEFTTIASLLIWQARQLLASSAKPWSKARQISVKLDAFSSGKVSKRPVKSEKLVAAVHKKRVLQIPPATVRLAGSIPLTRWRNPDYYGVRLPSNILCGGRNSADRNVPGM